MLQQQCSHCLSNPDLLEGMGQGIEGSAEDGDGNSSSERRSQPEIKIAHGITVQQRQNNLILHNERNWKSR